MWTARQKQQSAVPTLPWRLAVQPLTIDDQVLTTFYVSVPSGPRSTLRSAGLRPNWSAIWWTVSSSRINATPTASISSGVRVRSSIRLIAWRSISCLRNSTRLNTSLTTDRWTSSESGFHLVGPVLPRSSSLAGPRRPAPLVALPFARRAISRCLSLRGLPFLLRRGFRHAPT